MYRATFVLDLFHGEVDRRLSNRAMGHMLTALVEIDKDYLVAYPATPDLYNSGVRYVQEPPGQDDWQDIPTTLNIGMGDCEDLACWRCAELNVRYKVRAVPFFQWRDSAVTGQISYHIQVMLPNGQIEDPSRRLGMV